MENGDHSRKRSRDNEELSPVTKKPRLAEKETASLFDDPEYNDYKLFVTVEGETTAPRLLNVTKLMLAPQSPILKERIRANKEGLQVTLPRGTDIEHFVDLIRWVYAGVFRTPTEQLLSVVALAQEFAMESALEAAISELTSDMSVPKAAALLVAVTAALNARAERGAEKGETSHLERLLEKASQYLVTSFMEFDAVDVSPRSVWVTLPVEAVRVVLASPLLHVGCENSVFAAYRAWVHHDFDTRKHLAPTLLPLIRFPYLQPNYLMDVVRTEADLDYPEEAKKLFAKRLIECYIYHTGSDARREELKEPRPELRRYDTALLKKSHVFTIEHVSQGGYTFVLLFQRKNVDSPDGGTVGMYMHLKVRESGLGGKFFLPLEFELSVRNRVQNKFNSPKGRYSSPFTVQNRAWGYVDLLNMKWSEFVSPNSPFRENDTLAVKAYVDISEDAKKTGQQMPGTPVSFGGKVVVARSAGTVVTTQQVPARAVGSVPAHTAPPPPRLPPPPSGGFKL